MVDTDNPGDDMQPGSEGTRFKVVETSIVTDEELSKILNDCAEAGWILDHIDYISGPQSRRPQMAFLFFGRGLVAS